MIKASIPAFLLIFGFNLSVIAQEVTMEEYLRTALQDQSLERFRAQQDFLGQNKYNSPWLNRVELRVGSDDAEADLNDFRVRVSPANPFEVKANKVYHDKQLKHIGAQYEVDLGKALKNRYMLIIDRNFYVSSDSMLEAYQRDLINIRQNFALLGLGGIDAGDIVDIQSDEALLELKQAQVKYELDENAYHMRLDLPGREWIRLFSDIVTIDKINQLLLEQETLGNWSSPVVAEAEQELALEEQMLKIEKAESRSNIGYIQGAYDMDRGNELNEHLGFQVGIRLPLVNPDKPKLNRDRVDLIDEEMQVQATRVRESNRQGLALIRLKHLLNKYEIIERRLQQAMEYRLSLSAEIDLGDAIKLRKYQQRLQELKAEILRQTLMAFVEYLDVTGLMVQRPLINYLSADFKPIFAE